MGTKQILLIDRENDVRQILHLCLHHLGGWDVLSVASAQAGLEKLATVQPDAILLDVLIAGKEQDFQLIQDLQRHPQWCSIPVILVADRARWLSAPQMRQMGVYGAIPKPFNPVLLPQQICQLLNWSVERPCEA
jgi:CheY-like chemotaxis protein